MFLSLVVRLWDISYMWTAEGWLYLAVVLPLYSRAVIGWAVSTRLTGDLAQQCKIGGGYCESRGDQCVDVEGEIESCPIWGR